MENVAAGKWGAHPWIAHLVGSEDLKDNKGGKGARKGAKSGTKGVLYKYVIKSIHIVENMI